MCDVTPDLTPSLVPVHRSGDPTLRNDVLPPILVMMALFGLSLHLTIAGVGCVLLSLLFVLSL